MADATLYELLGISKKRADEIAKFVRVAFSESNSPAEWVQRLIDDFGVTREDADISLAHGSLEGTRASPRYSKLLRGK